MQYSQKFTNFLKSICDDPILYESIKKGYHVIIEGYFSDDIQMENISDGKWSFNSGSKKLNFSEEIAKEYCNLDGILSETQRDNLPESPNIKVGISGIVNLDQTNSIISFDTLDILLYMDNDMVKEFNITIPEVLTPNQSNSHSMLITSVVNLMNHIITVSGLQ